MRPKLLDLFCGAGGAGAGYHNAGFDVVGVDINPQPRYPFPFILGDALDVLRRMILGEKFLASDGRWYGLADFVAIHASPPCQKHTNLAAIWRAVDGYNYDGKHHDLIDKTRITLMSADKPFVIENVEGAPLTNPVMLCGTMFGLRLFRHRLFECSFFVLAPFHASPHSRLKLSAPRTGRQPKDGEVWSIYGHFSDVAGANEAMGCGWMTQKELAQAIPPAYTEYIGMQLMQVVKALEAEGVISRNGKVEVKE